MTIRNEQPKDHKEVLRLTYEAFRFMDFPGRRRADEHYLVHLLKDSSSVIRELSFVAEDEGKIVGHILYTLSRVTGPDGKIINTITFGPLSVLPERQRQGIGKALVMRSMETAKEMGFAAVIIAGVPEYYPKLGFKRGYELGLTLPDGSSPDALMAYELKEGSLAGGGVCKFLAPEYGKAEADDITGFHRAFINENYGGKLILRKFFDDDMELFKKWLYLPHISKWYECPDSWIKEVEGRHGKFSFINHFIAEAGGVPIGFCQYYDCYFGQGYEDWHKIERQGEVFSIDYFIGEPLFLGKGLGKGIVSLLTSMVKDKGGKRIIVGPEPDNTPSRRALEACGYAFDGRDYYIEF